MMMKILKCVFGTGVIHRREIMFKSTLFVFLIAMMIVLASPLRSQTPPSAIVVSLVSAKLTWDHDLLNVDSFLLDCGLVTHSVLAPSLIAPLADFITAPGQYTCTVRAVNKYGDSGLSNSVSFDAGDPPNDPTGASLIVQ